jgi:hypothetical protein
MSDDPGQPKLGKHGGPRTKGVRSAKIMPSGGRRDYILARLERDGRHDLAEAIREDRVSALTVAVEMGWTKRPETLGLGSGNAAKRRQHQLRAIAGDGLSLSQLQELWLGPNPSTGSLFGSREELVAAWKRHRAEVMRLWGSHGRRPMGWWEFDAGGLKHPGYDRERSTLWRAGVLSEAERTELELGWWADFDAAQKKDAQARREYYAWADIPPELIEAWSKRRRRGRQEAPSEEAAAAK